MEVWTSIPHRWQVASLCGITFLSLLFLLFCCLICQRRKRKETGLSAKKNVHLQSCNGSSNTNRYGTSSFFPLILFDIL